jgi:transcriptional regulator with XRE-family HTH domain
MVLTEIRESKNLSLRDVGEKMGCSHVAVSKLEKSKNPGILTLDRYASAVGVTLFDVVGCFKKMSTESYQSA